MDAQPYLNADTGTVIEHLLPGHRVACYLKPWNTERSNQDSAAVIQTSNDCCVLIVADGMGGGQSGDKASRLAVSTMVNEIRRTDTDQQPLRAGVLNGFEQAHLQVVEKLNGAATTLLVVEIQGDQARTYHVGDSAACVFGQRGKLKSQTGSHSPVGYALRSGLLNESQALHHEDRHYVSNMVGLEDMSVEVGLPFTLAPLDTFILGSDGLFDNLQLEEIIACARSGPLAGAVTKLAERSLSRMAKFQAGDSKLPSKPDDLTIVAHRLR